VISLFAAFDFVYLLPVAAFGAIAAAAWAALEYFAASKPRTDQRLEEMRDPSIRRRKEEDRSKNTGAMAKMLESATPALAKPLLPKSEKDASKLKLKLAHAGFRSEGAQSIFLGLKIVGLIVGLIIGGGTAVLMSGFTYTALFRLVMIAGGMFYMPDGILWFLAKKRKEAIFFGLPDALDLMVVCVEAGLGLDQAMRKVSEEMKKSYRVIADEFGLCNFQMQVGKSRQEVLHDLGNRSGVDDLRSLASIIIQADKFGSSIAQALRVQSDSMRTRRRQMAEEKAAKTAVKLIFPLVLFIFPGIFVILVGPAAITMMREMFPVMGGTAS
jgi:tight adherence protein C